MRNILIAFCLTALALEAAVTDLRYSNPGTPGVTIGDQLYTKTIRDNANILVISNQFRYIETNNVYPTQIVSSTTANITNWINYLSTNRVIVDNTMSQSTISNTIRSSMVNGATLELRGPFTNFTPFQGSSSYNVNSNLSPATLKFNSLTNINIVGVNALFDIHHTLPGTLFEFRNCDGVNMSDVTINWRSKNYAFHGNNFTSTQTVAINFYGLRNSTFKRIGIYNAHNHGFNQLPNAPLTISSNILFQDCTFYNVGCSNWGGTNQAVVDGAAIQVPPSSRIVNCNFYDCLRGVEIEGADFGGTTRDSQTEIQISGCNFYDSGEWSVGAIGTKGARVKIDNMMATLTHTASAVFNGSYGVYLSSTNTDFNINGSTFNNIATGVFVIGGVSSGLKIIGCSFTTNSNTGIVMYPIHGRGANGLNSTIIANNFFSQITGYGMDLVGLRYGTISGNTLWNTCINGSYKAPIFVRANDGFYSTTNVSSYLSIYGNAMHDTRGAGIVVAGIYLGTGVTNVNVFGNSISPSFGFHVNDIDRANIVSFDGVVAPSTVYSNGIGSQYMNRLTGKLYISTNQAGGWYPLIP